MLMNDSRIKDVIYFFRFAIVAFLIAVLISLTFKAGTMYACTGGYSDGLRCIDPKPIGLAQVCEYSPTCFSTCALTMVRDIETFKETYEDNAYWVG